MLGTLLGTALISGPLAVGSLLLYVNTLLFAAAFIVLGVQLMLFWVFEKVFAITEGLLLPDPRLERAFRYITLESGLIASAIALLVGIGLAVLSVKDWGSHSFGPLDPTQSMRRVIPAVLLIILGTQGMFSSFFLSILGLRRR